MTEIFKRNTPVTFLRTVLRGCASCFMVVCVLSTTSCATPPSDKNTAVRKPAATVATPEDFAAPERTIHYRCTDDRMASVTLRGAERAQLKIDGAATELAAVRTASGVKFQSADGTIIFWSKGNEATIDNGSGASLACQVAQ